MARVSSAGLRVALAAVLVVGLMPTIAVAQPDGGAPAGAPKGVESAPKPDETAEVSPEPLAEEGFLYDLDYELDSSGNATITGFAGGISFTDLDIVIPSEIDGHPVTCVGESAFAGYGGIESVVFSDGVSLIGNNAFSQCGNLTKVTFPRTDFNLGNSVFSNCESLKSVVIPSSLKSVGSDWRGVFYQSGLESAYVEEGIKKVPDYLFRNADELTSVSLPSSVEEVGQNSFEGCDSLESIILPAGLTIIDSNAFSSCESLKSIDLPESLASIGSMAFWGSGLQSVKIPKLVSEIGYSAFKSCDSLREVRVDSQVSCSLESGVFSDCPMLTDAFLSPFVSDAGADAFADTPLTAIKGYAGSTARTIAEECGLGFEAATDPLPIENASAEVNDAPLIYKGEPVVPSWTVTYGTLILQEGIDYTVSYENNDAIGTAIAKFTGAGLLEGALTKEFEIADPAEYADNVICVDDGPQRFSVTAYTSGTIVWSVSDPTVLGLGDRSQSSIDIPGYQSTTGQVEVIPLEPGYAELTASIGGQVISRNSIVVTPSKRIDIAGAAVSGVNPSYVFTGAEIMPEPTVAVNGITLMYSIDYMVSYENTRDAGSATLVITGIGAYRGETSVSYEIAPASMEDVEIASIPDQTFTGVAVEPFITAMLGAYEMAQGIDYSVEYRSNEQVGVATAVITGLGNVTGAREVEFRIVEPVEEPDPEQPSTDPDPDPGMDPDQPGTDPGTDSGKSDEPDPETVVFNDVIVGVTDHAAHIQWLADEGISKGWDNGDGTFSYRPYEEVARADMAAFLYRLAGKPAYEPSAENLEAFADVDKSTPHYKEILWLASTGISEGWITADGGHEFRPYASIARVDMSAFLHRLASWMGAGEPAGNPISFSDVPGSMAHSEDVAWLSASGITKGFQDGTYRPYQTIVRCDMAAMLHRLDGYVDGYDVA